MAAWNFVRKSGMIYHQQQGFGPSTQERLVEVEGNDENPPFWSLRVEKIKRFETTEDRMDLSGQT